MNHEEAKLVETSGITTFHHSPSIHDFYKTIKYKFGFFIYKKTQN
jgi:hypothetical protein